MYNLMYQLYFFFRRMIRRNIKGKNRRYHLALKIVGHIESYYNVFLKRYYERFPAKNCGVTSEKREQRIIVSLTSFPARIDTVWLTIESLFHQSLKADAIILWLAEEQFDGKDSLPKRLLDAEKRGLTIRFCDDLRSHKKYYYTMQEYPQDLIVLADDDLFYPWDMLKKLYNLHTKNPGDIITSTAAVISGDYSSVPSQWHAPEMKQKLNHSYIAQPFTGSGTLYPPKSISLKAFQKNIIMEHCPYADDLWLFYMALAEHTAVTVLHPYRDIPVSIDGTSSNSLWFINGQGMKNDTQWRAILDYFGDEDLPEINR